ncbi:MAG TPA: TonB-dependent receptor [Allosphingosinicella sp.]|nr:TonB-dependent receptor [Allosphingosinicella sp.]
MMRRSIRSAMRVGLMAGAATALAWAAPAAAQGHHHFHVPAGDAARTVQTVAIQAGVQVIAPNADLAGVHTPALDGDYTPAEAMRRLLAGSGLTVSEQGDGTLVVQHAVPGTQNPTGADSAMPGMEGPPIAEDQIVVTGTRIKRPGFDTLEAAFVTDANQIERRGYTSVAQALNETPGFVPSGVDPVGTGQGTFNAGQSFADFFGLGSQRTLTLVNGRRFVSSSTIAGSGSAAAPGDQVDLNLIPTELIARVETVAIGGAPVYGADAIAGTVNVILRDDFHGIRLSGQYGITEKGDAPGFNLRGAVGTNFAGGRGNVAVAAEYDRQDGLLVSARTGARVELPNATGGPPANIVAHDLVFGTMTPGGLPYSPLTFQPLVDGQGHPLQFGTGGNLVPFNLGQSLFPVSPILNLFADGGSGLNFADTMTLLAPTRRILVNGIGHYDITPGITFFTEATYAHSRGDEISDLAAFADPYEVGNFIPISINNAFLSPSARATMVANGTNTVLLGRNLSDILYGNGPAFRTTTDLFRIVGGLRGGFGLFGHPANWDVSFNYGRSHSLTETTYINDARFNEAVDAVVNGSGQIVCASGNPSCVPLDLFGVGQASPAALAYVDEHGSALSINTQAVANANLRGSLPFKVSTLPIDFNIGAEYRRETGLFRPDSVLSQDFNLLGFTYASAYQGQSGHYDTREVYGELSVPLVSDGMHWPLLRSVSVDGAARYVSNSIAGGDVTWSAGGRIAPRLPGVLDGLLFRGVYMRAIRAPAITELFSGASPTRDGIADPCDATRFNTGPNPSARSANCTAALAALGTTPQNFHATTFALSALGTVSGNPNLQNEKARSWSLGAVFQPPHIPGLRVAADWSHIHLTGGIESLAIGTIINACYDSSDYPNNSACQAFQRLTQSQVGPGSANPTRVTGDIANGYHSGYINISSLTFEGIIISAEYSHPVHALVGTDGRLTFTTKMLHNRTYISQATAGSPLQNLAGSVGLPKWSGQFNLSYADSRFDLLLQALWTGAVRNDLTATPDQLADSENRVGSYWKFNATVGFNVTERYRLQLVVDNLFNVHPDEGGYFSRAYGIYDIIGRRYLVRATVGF